MTKQENKNICAECGGFCCKKCGCDYFVNDIESFKIDELEKLLNTGHVSIVAFLEFKYLNNNVLGAFPTLYLRERNVDRNIIDLLSMKTTCASLTDNGCIYDLNNRPSGGATLIPKENMQCYSSVDRFEELKKWIPYQKVLEKLVKRHTGLSIQAKLKEDVENLVYNLYSNNIENVSRLELQEILRMMPTLKEAFPNEFNKGIIKMEKNNPYKKLLSKK